MKFLAVIGGLVLGAVLILYNAFAWGFIVYKFYYWFLMPIFKGLPVISLTGGIFIGMFTSLFHNHDVKEENKERDFKRSVIYISSVLIVPWIALFIGLIVKSFFIL